MLNFAEQTGSGAVIVVWLFLTTKEKVKYINTTIINDTNKQLANTRSPL